MSKRSIIISDPQEITCYAVRTLAERMQLFSSVTEAENFVQLAKSLHREPFAVCVVDYTLLDVTPERLLVTAERFPNAAFVLFSETLTGEFVKRMAFSSNSFGIVMKDAQLDSLRKAIDAASRGGRFLCNHARAMMHERETNAKSPLTSTEREILREIAFGLTSKQIAEKRSLSTYTVVTHRKNIFRKLGVNNAHEATRYALRAGIADSAEYYI